MADPIQYMVSPNDSLEVRAILETHVAYEQAKSMRQFWVHVLAFIGGLLALSMVLPEAGPTQLREVLVALWGACCTCAVVAGGLEWSWHRREVRLLSANAARRDH